MIELLKANFISKYVNLSRIDQFCKSSFVSDMQVYFRSGKHLVVCQHQALANEIYESVFPCVSLLC